MKNKAMFVFCLLGLIGVFSQNSSASTYYDNLADLFQTRSTKPDLTPLKGWYTGRCYLKNETTARASILVTSEFGNHGPRFGNKEIYKSFPLINKKIVSNSYDVLTPDLELALSEVSDSLAGALDEVTETTLGWKSIGGQAYDEEVSVEYISLNSWEIRTADGYAIVEVETLDDNNLPVINYCYYFAKIK